jgi:hypothetical protein
MCTTNTARPVSAADAIAAIRAGLAYVTAQAAQLTGAVQADCQAMVAVEPVGARSPAQVSW